MASGSTPARNRRSKNVAEFDQPNKRRPFSVFLIVDDLTERAAIVSAISELKIPIQEYMTAREFVFDYRENIPGVVITEFRLRDMTAFELQEQLKSSEFDIPMVLLISPADSGSGVKAMRFHGMDFVLKHTAETTLSKAIWRSYCQWYDVDWEFVAIDLNEVDECLKRLTEREHQVLNLMSEGLSSREISGMLKVSVKTVEAHRARINDKMRANDLADLSRMLCAWHEETQPESSG